MNNNSGIDVPTLRPFNTTGARPNGTTSCILAVIATALSAALLAPQTNAAVHTVGLDIAAGNTSLAAGDTFNVGINDMVQASTKRGGIRAQSGAIVDVTNNGGITATIGNPMDTAGSGYSSRGVWIDLGASVHLGSGSAITMYADPNAQGIGISNQGNLKAHAINITAVGDSSVALVSASSEAYSYLGAGSRLTGGFAAIDNYNGATTIAENALLSSSRQDRGTIQIGEGTVTLTNSTVKGEGMGIELSTTAGNSGKLGTVNIAGGSVYSKAGPAISSVSTSGIAYNHVINVSEGATVASDSGILYDDKGVASGSAGSFVKLIATGEGTTMQGRIHSRDESNKVVTLALDNNATWSSTGYSNFDTLILDNANIDLTITSATDRIYVRELDATGSNVISIGFSDSFISEILNDTPYVGIAFEAVEGLFSDIIFDYAVANQNYSWTIADNGDGSYTISNIIAVPEPATYAAIITVTILVGTIAHRRRPLFTKASA